MHNSKGYFYATVDVLVALVVVFMALSAFALMAAVKNTDNAVTPGSVMFQLSWPKSDDADVDLWVQAPDDNAVGYSQQNSIHCNLLRDDLGKSVDSESRNLELTVCRGLPDGEWIANVVLYSFRNGPTPVIAYVVAIEGTESGQTEITRHSALLTKEGQQLTVFRFRTQKGKLVPGSVNDLSAILWRHG